ncbi:hypothetical protein BD779DRAFT_282977 [Infundibulicybe gibba]|nr:hypothetical protein BD779DRAFT_282977 [Infundibulicybe gibba]
MASSNARNVRIKESAFYNARRDINNNTHHIQGDYNNHAINIHGEHDPRSCVHSAMKDYIDTDAYHDSGARRDPSRCYPGTREAALKTIFDWAQCSASHCLWLYGPAGTGKSAIARTFSDHCCQDKTLGATYFFTRGSTSSPGPPPLFSTLIYQLMSVFPSLDEHLWEVIRMDRTIFRRSLSTQLDKLIVQPFLKLADKSTSAVVVIDGLDECDGDSIQGEIVRLILSLERHSLPLLFLISSRPESEIRRAFESFPRSSLARIPLDKALHPDRDIRHFLVSEFERIYQQSVRMGMPPVSQLPWPPTEDVETLVQKSSGHFIYAATVIRFVEEDRAHPMDRLDAILDIPNGSTSSSATFAHSIAFQELDNLYLHILRKQHLNRVRLVKILHTIAHLSRYNSRFSPTLSSPSNIEVIFDLRPGTVRFMLEGLLSIIDVPASANYWQPLRFFHASFNDFLVDPERSTHEFYLETSRFNAELACEYMRLIVG